MHSQHDIGPEGGDPGMAHDHDAVGWVVFESLAVFVLAVAVVGYAVALRVGSPRV